MEFGIDKSSRLYPHDYYLQIIGEAFPRRSETTRPVFGEADVITWPLIGRESWPSGRRFSAFSIAGKKFRLDSAIQGTGDYLQLLVLGPYPLIARRGHVKRPTSRHCPVNALIPLLPSRYCTMASKGAVLPLLRRELRSPVRFARAHPSTSVLAARPSHPLAISGRRLPRHATFAPPAQTREQAEVSPAKI